MANVPVPTQPVDVDIAPIIAEFSAANKELRESELFVTEAQLAATRAKERFTIAKAALREALKT